MNQWEVWFAKFPYEEDQTIIKERPVIILDIDTLECLAIKVTSHNVRDEDAFDTPIEQWKEAGLKRPSVARISKTMNLSKDNFVNKKGEIQKKDREIIINRFIEYMKTKQ